MGIEIFLLLGWITALALLLIKFHYRYWANASIRYTGRQIYNAVTKALNILLVVLLVVAVFNLVV